MPDDFQYDVFLSHGAKDRTVVRPLAERLRKDGVKVWLVPPEPPGVGGFGGWEIKPGDSIKRKQLPRAQNRNDANSDPHP